MATGGGGHREARANRPRRRASSGPPFLLSSRQLQGKQAPFSSLFTRAWPGVSERAVAPRPIPEGPRHPGPFFLRFPPALRRRADSAWQRASFEPRQPPTIEGLRRGPPDRGPLRPSQNRDHVTTLLRAPRPGPHILIPALHCGPRRPEAPGRIRVRRRCPARWAPILVSARVGRQGPARGSAQFPGHNSAGRTDLQRREAPAGSEPGPCRA